MLSSCFGSAVWLTLALLMPPLSNTCACSTLPRLRPLDVVLARTLAETYVSSPTVRALVDELQRSNVITYMDLRPRYSRWSGALQFVTTGGAFRFVRITLDESLPRRALAATLGHELQHAVEVARASQVVDHMSFAALYRRIGHQTSRGVNSYETAAAQQVGSRVFAELRGKHVDLVSEAR